MENFKAALILFCNTNIIELQNENKELSESLTTIRQELKKITDDEQAKSTFVV